jgi:hypothetical protein
MYVGLRESQSVRYLEINLYLEEYCLLLHDAVHCGRNPTSCNFLLIIGRSVEEVLAVEEHMTINVKNYQKRTDRDKQQDRVLKEKKRKEEEDKFQKS